MSDTNCFVQLSTSLEPWVIGFLGLYIALNQWRTSNRQTEIAANKLKFDLFQSRIAIYEAVQELFLSINRGETAKSVELNKYFLSIHQARWLLDDELYKYLEKDVVSKIRELRRLDLTIGRLARTEKQEERERSLDAQEQLFDWFYKQMDDLDRKFEPFLRLQH